jgi:arylsulfatase A-like enzyme
MPKDLYGYPANAAVRPHLLGAAADPRFALVFLHLNESDTAGHEYGPRSEAAREAYRACDAVAGELIDALRPSWPETVLIVVSDHDMEPQTGAAWIELLAHAAVRELADDVVPDGGCALLHRRPGVGFTEIEEAVGGIEGVRAAEDAGDGIALICGEPGRTFSPARHPGGFHGGLATARTVAVVGGGHPEAARLADAIRQRRPHLADWAPTIAGILGVPLRDVDGQDLRYAGAMVSR